MRDGACTQGCHVCSVERQAAGAVVLRRGSLTSPAFASNLWANLHYRPWCLGYGRRAGVCSEREVTLRIHRGNRIYYRGKIVQVTAACGPVFGAKLRSHYSDCRSHSNLSSTEQNSGNGFGSDFSSIPCGYRTARLALHLVHSSICMYFGSKTGCPTTSSTSQLCLRYSSGPCHFRLPPYWNTRISAAVSKCQHSWSLLGSTFGSVIDKAGRSAKGRGELLFSTEEHGGTRRTAFLSAEERGGARRTAFVRGGTRRGAENTKGVLNFLCAAAQPFADQSHFAP